MLHFGNPEAQRRGAQAGSPFLLGTFLLAKQKKSASAAGPRPGFSPETTNPQILQNQ
jgi:hypothetical protein